MELSVGVITTGACSMLVGGGNGVRVGRCEQRKKPEPYIASVSPSTASRCVPMHYIVNRDNK